MTRNVKKISLLIIAAVLVMAVAFAGAASADYVEVDDWEGLVANVSGWTNTDEMRTIVVMQDLTNTTGSTGGNYLGIPVNGKVTIKPKATATGEVKIDANQQGRLFDVKENGNLTLCGNQSSGTAVLNLTGGKMTGTSAGIREGGAIYVNGGNLTFSAGAKISNSTAVNNGGGVYVNSGTFNMTGDAVISHCNTSKFGGGGVYLKSGTFTMYDNAKITGCNATGSGGGVYVYQYASFTMYDNAKITGCNATGSGGGVYVNSGTFNMYDNAKITSCNATVSGGGVYVSQGTFNMTGDASITGCNATKSGGGVYVSNSMFNMTGDASITGCNVKTDGGGVYVSGYWTFNMTGGASITGCTAANNGGGVYATCTAGGGTFNMTGGTITDCNAKMDGGGVYVNSGTFNMSGKAFVDANNDVYLSNGKYITLGGAFDSNAYGAFNITLAGTVSNWVGKTIVKNGADNQSYFKLSSKLSGYALENGTGTQVKDLVLVKSLPKYVEVNTWQELAANVTEWTDKVNERTIVVMQGLTNTTGTGNYAGIPVNGKVTIMPNATATGEVKIDANQKGRLFNVTSTGNLTLCGNQSGGTAVLNLTNGKYTPDSDAAGGAIYVDGGNLTLSTGAKITNSTAKDGCGVYIYTGKFTMSGDAQITHCNATGNGGGVFVDQGTFDMTDTAIISYCNATGDGGQGGGVYNYGTFNMTDDANISHCNATVSGGGVFVDQGTFDMTGNAQISHCNATGDGGQGGGVYNYGTFNMTDDANISYCNATGEDGCGGGVYNGYQFTMTGGTIINCSAEVGGGVFVIGGTFNMTGGTISDCSAEVGGGVYIATDVSLLTIGGSATITSDVALRSVEMDPPGQDALMGTINADIQNDKIRTFNNIVLDRETSFTGTVSSIRLYDFIYQSSEFEENVTVWKNQIIVKNGNTSAKNRFSLSTGPLYSGLALNANGEDLVLGDAPSYPISITNATGTYQLSDAMTKVYGDTGTGSGYANLTKVEGDTYTLELNNFKASNFTANKPIINASVPNLTIKLVGDSNLTGSRSDRKIGLIHSSGNLTITTDNGGKLLVNNTASSATAIYAGNDVTIEKGTVNATGGTSAIRSESGNITIHDGTATLNATDSGSWAINAQSGNVIIENGTIDATATGRAISAQSGNVIIENGTIDATATGDLGHAIYATYVIIENGTVNATGEMEAIYAKSDITIHDGTVNATATGNAIHASGNVTITSVDQLIANGAVAFAYYTQRNFSGLNTGYEFLVNATGGSEPTVKLTYDQFNETGNWTGKKSVYTNVLIKPAGPSMNKVFVVDKVTKDNEFLTLEDAYSNVTNGGTIYLKKNVDLAKTFDINKPVTIEGNYHTIKSTSDTLLKNNLIKIISTDKDVTLQNLTVDFNGKPGDVFILDYTSKAHDRKPVILTNVKLTGMQTTSILDTRSALHIAAANVTAVNLTFDQPAEPTLIDRWVSTIDMQRISGTSWNSTLYIDSLPYGAYCKAVPEKQAEIYKISSSGAAPQKVDPITIELLVDNLYVWPGFEDVVIHEVSNWAELASAANSTQPGEIIQLTQNIDSTGNPPSITILAGVIINPYNGNNHYKINLTSSDHSIIVNDYLGILSTLGYESTTVYGDGYINASSQFKNIDLLKDNLYIPPGTSIQVERFISDETPNNMTVTIPKDGILNFTVDKDGYIYVKKNKNFIVIGEGSARLVNDPREPTNITNLTVNGTLTFKVPITWDKVGIKGNGELNIDNPNSGMPAGDIPKDMKDKIEVAPITVSGSGNGDIIDKDGNPVDTSKLLVKYNSTWTITDNYMNLTITNTTGTSESYILSPDSGYTGKWVKTETKTTANSDSSGTLVNAGQFEAVFTKNSQPYTPSHSKETGSTVILKDGEVAPIVNPTATPTATPGVPTIAPSTKPTTQPTQKSPAPFVGIIAGLGAVLVIARLRR